MRSYKHKLSATLWLIIVNSVLFAAMFPLLLTGNFVEFIAIKPINIINGKYLWTIVTSMFMHAGFFHLFINMMSLFFLGSFLEQIIGKKRFLWLYFISGISASLLFVLLAFVFQRDMNALAVGASGAIFGLAGCIAVLTPKLKVYIMPFPFPLPMWIASIIALSVLWLASAAAGLPIGNTAHLGGLIAGLLFGFYLRIKYRRKVIMLNRLLGLK